MARKHNRTGRSRTASFAMLPHFLLSSPAWRSLSLSGRATYIEIIALYVPGRNGRLAMSARTLAERLPISRATAARAVKEFSGRGFIEFINPGGFNVKSGTSVPVNGASVFTGVMSQASLLLVLSCVGEERKFMRRLHQRAATASQESQVRYEREKLPRIRLSCEAA